ncbi:MAG TPA: YggS family pyridoxal phosphate-dependent enzyme [Bacteroidales bacterium]|nr:YggS family pyridoxal phosphate-dependent enzyme [Bacteroidales bacterium]HXK82509.1 YggS family pyridoxal phosphate-dependent enzyme [Bacteroidales bacterium]
MDICERIENITKKIPDYTTLVAVSKTHSVETVKQAYNCGQKVFGENKVQELVSKYEQLPKDIQWHMIGHLQRNKVKYIAPFVSLIHSVDSFKLLREIEKQAKNNKRTISCLLQFHIANEETKFGFNIDEVCQMIESNEFKDLQNVNVTGVMGMASFTNDMEQVKEEFKTLKKYFDILKSRYFISKRDFKDISMGMTNDWEIALEEGSTMLRIGTSIFGSRSCMIK